MRTVPDDRFAPQSYVFGMSLDRTDLGPLCAVRDRPVGVVVIDDHPLMRDGIVRAIRDAPGLAAAGVAGGPEEGMALALRARPDVAVVHVADPTALVRRLLDARPGLRLVVLVESEAPVVLDEVAEGRAGWVSSRATAAELVRAVRAVNRGESVLAPGVTAGLLREYARARLGDRPLAERLTRREERIVSRMAEGATDTEIARELSLSRRTVQRALARARRVARVGRRSELSRWVADQAFFRDTAPDDRGPDKVRAAVDRLGDEPGDVR
jgi:DNA-binding NarL/FixJ family response regulator